MSYLLSYPLTIELLHPDAIQYLMTFMNPREWYIFCLLSKSCHKICKKFMTARKKSYFNICSKYAYGKPNTSIECLRPLMKLQPSGTGCSGKVKRGLCVYHRVNKSICTSCNKYIVSSLTFGPYCDSPKCRDYIWILCDGLAVKKYSFNCIIGTCSRKTDIKDGKCLICSRNEQVEQMEIIEKSTTIVRCYALTLSGTRCKITTSSWTGKCTIHLKKK